MPTLDWVNRDDAFRIAQRVPTRVLRPHAAGGVHGDASQGNLLVQGDNLEALKTLLPFYRGRVKCIFIDPPYNTKSAFEHYDDNLEHSQWLTMILPRLQLLREFLREDGSIWVTFPFRKRFKSELGELVPTTIWLNEEVGNNREAKQEITRVFGRDDILDTPKLWLPTSFGRLYPDFVCELTDGRLLVAEYKGEHLRNVPKEIEKGEVGRLWAEHSGGSRRFAMLF